VIPSAIVNARDREAARYRQEAAELRKQADAALDAGDRAAGVLLIERAILREEVADGLEAGRGAALLSEPRSANVQEMTSAQHERRGRARAKNLAKGDRRREAIAARWGSLRKAAEAAGVSPASLTGYLDGLYPCPKVVAEVFAVDPALPPTRDTWKKGVVK
jgi:hypothetical protein